MLVKAMIHRNVLVTTFGTGTGVQDSLLKMIGKDIVWHPVFGTRHATVLRTAFHIDTCVVQWFLFVSRIVSASTPFGPQSDRQLVHIVVPKTPCGWV